MFIWYALGGSTTLVRDGTGVFYSNQTQCPGGLYCVGGTASVATGDGPCAAGNYCPAGSTTPTGRGPCAAGYFCPAGSATPTGSVFSARLIPFAGIDNTVSSVAGGRGGVVQYQSRGDYSSVSVGSSPMAFTSNVITAAQTAGPMMYQPYSSLVDYSLGYRMVYMSAVNNVLFYINQSTTDRTGNNTVQIMVGKIGVTVRVATCINRATHTFLFCHLSFPRMIAGGPGAFECS